MNIDSFYTIGDSHRECQDYACANKEQGTLAISDGCSSSKFTDIGARAAVHDFLDHSEYNINRMIKNISSKWICLESQNFIQQISEINYSALDCTLFGINTNMRKMFLCGDGAYAYKVKEYLYIVQRQYKSNYPYYISYLIQDKKLEEKPEEIRTTYYHLDNDLHRQYNQAEHSEVYDFPKEVESIAVFSDGVESFSSNGIHISAIEVIKFLMDIKRFNGEFAQRQLNKLKRHCKQNNWTHYDDLSMAIVKF